MKTEVLAMEIEYGYTPQELEGAITGLIEKYKITQEISPYRLYFTALTDNEYAEKENAEDTKEKALTLVKELGAAKLFGMGLLYYTGNGAQSVEQDRKKAVAYFAVAAEHGHVEAMFNTAFCFMNGDGLAQNRKEALYWFIKAAQNGNDRSIYFLADFHMAGYGVIETNAAEAAKYYGTSANMGHPASFYNLGALLYNGIGIAKDEYAGLKLIEKAAELGFTPNQ
ncbi:MAG: sel1 repeat family protein [Oscillospiraceae bacterium]|jgi:TPR repeat protein|nr:sel1 repeat family protein [Oscillospiraceae bacterium]